MSVSGLFLLLFLTLHLVANFTILWGSITYNAVCDFMGTNPLVQVMVPILALGFAIHILLAFVLSLRNYLARGNQRYAKVSRKGVPVNIPNKMDAFAGRNMLILGVLILIGLGLHLWDFWAKMQMQQFMGNSSGDGYLLTTTLFKNARFAAIYILWFAVLWFHLNHGFWSAFQSIGFNNNTWLPRLKTLSLIYSTLLCAGFTIIVLYCLLLL